MRSIFIIVAYVFLSLNSAQAQEKKETNLSPIKDDGKHEIKINMATAIGGFPELSYEYFPIDNMGIGISAGFAVEDKEFLTNRAQFTPYYRLYFGNKKSSGFFIEGNMAYSFQAETTSEIIYDTLTSSNRTINSSAKSSGFGFGAAIGVKLLARNRFTGEIYAGGGRLFNRNIIGGYPRVGLSLGIRL
jgi:hypothetical protein